MNSGPPWIKEGSGDVCAYAQRARASSSLTGWLQLWHQCHGLVQLMQWESEQHSIAVIHFHCFNQSFASSDSTGQFTAWMAMALHIFIGHTCDKVQKHATVGHKCSRHKLLTCHAVARNNCVFDISKVSAPSRDIFGCNQQETMISILA